MINCRRKNLFLALLSFFLVSAMFLHLAEQAGSRSMHRSLKQCARDLIRKLREMPDKESLVELLRTEKQLIFFRATLFDAKGLALYDTRLAAPERTPEIDSDIQRALKYGRSYGEHDSPFFRQKLAYAAMSFETHGSEYVLRVGFPLTKIRSLMRDVEICFLFFGLLLLGIYSLLAWSIFHRLSRPIREILTAIHLYQNHGTKTLDSSDKRGTLPALKIRKELLADDEFGAFVQMITSLDEKVRTQIGHLIQQRNETEAILQSLNEGIIAVDSEGIVTFANRAAGCMLDTSDSVSLVGQKFRDIASRRPDLIQKGLELLSSATEKMKTVTQTLLVEETRKVHFDLIAVPPARHNGPILVLQNKTADHELLDIGKDFIANASHELRTPITVIRGFAEMLHELPHSSQELSKSITEKILKTSLRLDALIKSLLTLADIENLTANQFSSTDLVSLAQNCRQFLLAAHPDAQIFFRADNPTVPIQADPNLLEMAIMNLLENARKYSPAPAQITMAIACGADGFVHLGIQDQGMGIPQTDLPRIFERFYTVNKAHSRKFGGAGLGLSIVKTIVQKHGGSISVSSQLNQGSTFTISLPFRT